VNFFNRETYLLAHFNGGFYFVVRFVYVGVKIILCPLLSFPFLSLQEKNKTREKKREKTSE